MAERRRAAPAGRSRRPASFPSSRHATEPPGRRDRRAKRRHEKGGSATAVTRMERRRLQERRRTRTMVIGSALLAVLVLVAWFPGGALLQQHAALAATDSQDRMLQRQDAALFQEQKNLNTPSEIERIAREQYDLVLPGQAAFQVLPPNGTATGTDTPYPGDPGLATPVEPSGAPELPPGGVAASSTGVTHHQGSAHQRPQVAAAASSEAGGILSRIVRTLEFWR